MLIEPTLGSDLLAGRVAIVTGGSRGIGGATSSDLVAPRHRAGDRCQRWRPRRDELMPAIEDGRSVSARSGARWGALLGSARAHRTRTRKTTLRVSQLLSELEVRC